MTHPREVLDIETRTADGAIYRSWIRVFLGDGLEEGSTGDACCDEWTWFGERSMIEVRTR